MSRCTKRDVDLGRCILVEGHAHEHRYPFEHIQESPESPSVDPIQLTAIQAMNALSEAIMALNPHRSDLAVAATSNGIMVFYDKDKGFPLLPAFTATPREA